MLLTFISEFQSSTSSSLVSGPWTIQPSEHYCGCVVSNFTLSTYPCFFEDQQIGQCHYGLKSSRPQWGHIMASKRQEEPQPVWLIWLCDGPLTTTDVSPVIITEEWEISIRPLSLLEASWSLSNWRSGFQETQELKVGKWLCPGLDRIH